ncbi:hypothetical protein B0H13DRAFT_2415548 [Mycena leptocephala]|nr:hypothetical protein B0H13DRAFT_2415548 [Mycena leptocephala]
MVGKILSVSVQYLFPRVPGDLSAVHLHALCVWSSSFVHTARSIHAVQYSPNTGKCLRCNAYHGAVRGNINAYTSLSNPPPAGPRERTIRPDHNDHYSHLAYGSAHIHLHSHVSNPRTRPSVSVSAEPPAPAHRMQRHRRRCLIAPRDVHIACTSRSQSLHVCVGSRLVNLSGIQRPCPHRLTHVSSRQENPPCRPSRARKTNTGAGCTRAPTIAHPTHIHLLSSMRQTNARHPLARTYSTATTPALPTAQPDGA